MRATLLLLVAPACLPSSIGGDIDASLATYHELHISAREDAVDILIGKPFDVTQYAPCPILDIALAGRFAGTPASVLSRGGKIGESPGDDVIDNDCGVPRLRIDAPPPAGSARLEISDPSFALSCSLPDLRATRQIETVPPNAWDWQLGQQVTLQWSTAGELATWRAVLVSMPHHTPDGTVDFILPLTDVTFADDLIHVTVPTTAPNRAGSYSVSVIPTTDVACAPNNVPASLRSTLTSFAASHPVTLSP